MRTRRTVRNQQQLWRELAGIKPPAKRKGPRFPMCPNVHLAIYGPSADASWCCASCAAKARIKDELRHKK